MASSDPLFELSFKRWPPIYRYKRKQTGQKTVAAEVVTTRPEVTPDPSLANLVDQERHPLVSIPQQEQGNRPASSSSEALSSVPLMNPYPITFPVPLPELLPPLRDFPPQ